MRRIVAFQTSDNVVHATVTLAGKHASRRYDDAMTSIRHAIVASDSFGRITHSEASKMLAWVEENFDRIAEARALKEDRDLMTNTVNDEDD